MLTTLSIKDFILIESTILDFSSGFHAITGETGSGKSMILDALMFALGGRCNTDIVRDGADSASVVVEFTAGMRLKQIAAEYGIDIEDSIIIKRQQFKEGRKKCFINNEPVSSKIISMIAENLIEIHGQHSYGSLLKPSFHLDILDEFAEIGENRQKLQEKYNTFNALLVQKRDIEENRLSMEREIEFLEHATLELKNKLPSPGEEEELSNKRISLKHSERRADMSRQVKDTFENANFALTISHMQKILRNNKDDAFDELRQNFDQIEIYLNEAENAVKALVLDNLEDNLEDVEARLFEIKDLSRKYKIPSDQLIGLLARYEAELAELQDKVHNSDQISNQLKSLEEEYKQLAEVISEKRKIAGLALSKKVTQELGLLNMRDCSFVVDISALDKITSTGMDNVRFVASINKGQAMQPIDKIASGGEMSRLMLALNIVLFDKNGESCVIFDEIDTGIGGKIASSVGDRLRELSKVVQTIAITHQPQVASKADHNILVVKSSSGGKSQSMAKFLSIDDKKEEIARMISGKEITEKARDAATELLSQ